MTIRGEANFSFQLRTQSARSGSGGPLSPPTVYRTWTIE